MLNWAIVELSYGNTALIVKEALFHGRWNVKAETVYTEYINSCNSEDVLFTVCGFCKCRSPESDADRNGNDIHRIPSCLTSK